MRAEKVYSESEVEDMIERQQGSSHMLGISSGWEEATNHVRTSAAEFFRLGKDHEATLLRDLSDEMRRIQYERRKAYDDREAEIASQEKQSDDQS